MRREEEDAKRIPFPDSGVSRFTFHVSRATGNGTVLAGLYVAPNRKQTHDKDTMVVAGSRPARTRGGCVYPIFLPNGLSVSSKSPLQR